MPPTLARTLSVAIAAVLVLSACSSEPEEVPAVEDLATVGLALPDAVTALEDAGYTATFEDTREDRSVWDQSNWVVTDVLNVDGTDVVLGVEKADDDEREAEAAERAAAADERDADREAYAARIEQATYAAFGGEDLFSEACDFSDPLSWPCYVASWNAHIVGDVYVVLQVDRDDEELGERAAFAIFSLVGGEHEDLEIVQALAADGHPLATLTRSDIPMLNQ